jgi:mRNA interferase RelE/StbE
MTVAVVLTESAQKDILGLPAKVQARVAAKVADLADYPTVSGVKALKGALKGTLRVRVGDYRILFTVAAGTLTIVSVDDRKEAY